MALWILMLCFGLSYSLNTYRIEDTTSIEVSRSERFKLQAVDDQSIKEVWILGRFPSDKMLPEEGRMGTHFKNRELPGKPWLQEFTLRMVGGRPGETLELELWQILPDYAEQYFNDPEVYHAQHGKYPTIKKIPIKVKENLDF